MPLDPFPNSEDYISRIRDPLSETTRKERRTLLAVSSFSILAVKADLIPSRIPTLGLNFDNINKPILLNIIAFFILYFLIAFLIYATSDFLMWRIAYQEAIAEKMTSFRIQKSLNIRRIGQSSETIYSYAEPVITLRSLFDFLLPIFTGIYAMVVLIGGT